MKTVGIKELKNSLSHYLRVVQSGEVVRVTDRNEIVAEIHQPKRSKREQRSRWEKWLDAQERAGHLRRATATAPPWRLITTLPRPTTPVDLQKLLDETRADRF